MPRIIDYASFLGSQESRPAPTARKRVSPTGDNKLIGKIRRTPMSKRDAATLNLLGKMRG